MINNTIYFKKCVDMQLIALQYHIGSLSVFFSVPALCKSASNWLMNNLVVNLHHSIFFLFILLFTLTELDAT